MRTIILHLKTGKYRSNSGWTKDRSRARDFNGIDNAMDYRAKRPFKHDLQIIHQAGDKPSLHDIILQDPQK